jgi:putative endonuclease
MNPPARRARGARAQRRGVDAEAVACVALSADGWIILGQRLRTPAGEVDIVARRGDLLAFIEVKARPSLAQAAYALSARQSRRLLSTAEILLAANPDWSAADIRFDVILVDAGGRARRIADALRCETPLP